MGPVYTWRACVPVPSPGHWCHQWCGRPRGGVCCPGASLEGGSPGHTASSGALPTPAPALGKCQAPPADALHCHEAAHSALGHSSLGSSHRLFSICHPVRRWGPECQAGLQGHLGLLGRFLDQGPAQGRVQADQSSSWPGLLRMLAGCCHLFTCGFLKRHLSFFLAFGGCFQSLPLREHPGLSRVCWEQSQRRRKCREAAVGVRGTPGPDLRWRGSAAPLFLPPAAVRTAGSERQA